ncbi:MAG: cyclic nucleotide-binding domain-containing protein [Methanobacteriota archaeon]
MKSKLIDPDRYFKESWDIIIAILTIFLAIEIPLRLAFDYPLLNIYIEIIITLLLVIDIIINFITQIYSKGILIKNQKQITHRYIRKLFFFDLIAAIPFALLTLVFPGVILIRWLSLTRLFKLLRLNSLISKWRNHQVINPSVLRLGVFFFWIFLLAHGLACLWIYIARIENLDTIPTYMNAIYWTITTITTVGYGDITPITDLQKILTMAAMIIGVGVYGFVIGNIASLLSNIDIAKTSFLKQMEDVNSFLTYKSVPKRLKQKVQNYFHYVWDNQLAQCEHEILNTLPLSLKTEISMQIHRKLIEHVPFFQNTDKEFISDIISQVQPQVFLPEDHIFKKGDIGDCMYFICNGSLDVLSDDEKSSLATLKEGDYFGEIALIKKVTRTRSVQAKEYCNLYALEKKNFDTLLEKYPIFKKNIYETLQKREAPSADQHIKM